MSLHFAQKEDKMLPLPVSYFKSERVRVSDQPDGLLDASIKFTGRDETFTSIIDPFCTAELF